MGWRRCGCSSSPCPASCMATLALLSSCSSTRLQGHHRRLQSRFTGECHAQACTATVCLSPGGTHLLADALGPGPEDADTERCRCGACVRCGACEWQPRWQAGRDAPPPGHTPSCVHVPVGVRVLRLCTRLVVRTSVQTEEAARDTCCRHLCTAR